MYCLQGGQSLTSAPKVTQLWSCLTSGLISRTITRCELLAFPLAEVPRVSVLQLDLSNLRGLEMSPPALRPRHTDPGHSRSCAAQHREKTICLAHISRNPQRMCWVMLACLPGVHSLGASVKSQFCGAEHRDGSEGVRLH